MGRASSGVPKMKFETRGRRPAKKLDIWRAGRSVNGSACSQVTTYSEWWTSRELSVGARGSRNLRKVLACGVRERQPVNLNAVGAEVGEAFGV